MLTSQIVAKVATEGFTPADVLDVVNERYLEANAEARWHRVAASLGTTVAGQSNYTLPLSVVDLDYLRIGTTEYQPAGQEQVWGLQSGRLNLRGTGGLFVPDFVSGDQIEIYPAPTTTGTAIETLQVADPSLLTTTPDTTPVFPADLHGRLLIDGPIALIRARADERIWSAQFFEGRFQEGVEMLKQRANRRVGGNRPRQAQLAGRDF